MDPESRFTAAALQAALTAIAGDVSKFAVAFSGGADSTALLHALRECQGTVMTKVKVRALHFNHRIHPDADQWLAQCATVCKMLEVPFEGTIWDESPGARCSEDVARTARYRWLQMMLQEDEVLLTAHHAGDQAETVLLSLLEGRGVHRLAGIPARRNLGRSANLVARPLLGFTGQALRNYLDVHDVDWIEDPSNDDTRHRRNFVRHHILPQSRDQFPDCDRALVTVAGRVRELMELVSGYIADDLEQITDPGSRRVLCLAPPIRLDALRTRRKPVQRTLLRRWVNDVSVNSPSDRQLDEFARQLNRAATRDPATENSAAGASLKFSGYQMVVHGSHIYLIRVSEPAVRDAVSVSGLRHEFGNGVGALMKPAGGIGINYRQPGLYWRWRQGGERFLPGGANRSSSLKKLLQAADIPGFERRALPLLWEGETLLWVNGLGFSDALSLSAARSDTEDAVIPSFFASDISNFS